MTPGSRAAATARGRRVSITDPATIDLHCELVAREMRAGRVIPFLGAGANLCGRPEEHVWNPLRFDWLPSGKELAKYLAGLFAYQGKHPDDLLKVSQYIKLMVGAFPLYAELRKLFNGDYPPTALHEFLAEVPTILRRHLDPPPYQLIVTTNYDDVPGPQSVLGALGRQAYGHPEDPRCGQP